MWPVDHVSPAERVAPPIRVPRWALLLAVVVLALVATGAVSRIPEVEHHVTMACGV